METLIRMSEQVLGVADNRDDTREHQLEGVGHLTRQREEELAKVILECKSQGQTG